MATLKAHKSAGAGFGNEIEVRRIVFEVGAKLDSGSTGALDILTATEALMVVGFWSKVITSGVSSGSATLKVGVTGDDDRFMNTTQGAVAELDAGAVIIPPALEGTPNVLPVPVKLAAGDKILQTIGTEAMTVCKIEYVILLMKP